MTTSEDTNRVLEVIDEFRRRAPSVAARRLAAARREYLTPELRTEAEELKASIDAMYGTMVDRRVAARVRRMRAGASLQDSRFNQPKR